MNMSPRWTLLAVVALLLTSCATIAPCPNNLLPIVEIQMNSTASNHDDYGTTTANLVSRARITNPTNFNGAPNFANDVAIEVRNPAGISNLGFATSALGTPAPSLFLNLPSAGGWLTFYVRGNSTSSVDKSAIVEISTAGSCDETVLARKAMMIPFTAPPIPATTAQQFEIEINHSSATLDDYVAWSPTPSRIRWANGTSSTATTTVTLRNMAGTNHLRFADSTLPGGSTASAANVTLTLNGDGSWMNFFIAGCSDNLISSPPCSPSSTDKDAVLEVRDASNNVLTREGLMVRLRKNADVLSPAETARYLEALRKVNMTFALNAANADYLTFVKTHSRDSSGAGGSQIAHRQAHGGSGFLPWHRAFVLHIERLLQSADPSVALPYWKFDDNAPNMFTTTFMGANTTGNMVNLDPNNPIVSWALTGEFLGTGIQRRTPYGDGGHPALATETATLGLGGVGFLFSGFKTMEGSAHNPAHFNSGNGISWIAGSPAIATRDPLFFFLHSNVDRLWAKWQWVHDRTDTSATNCSIPANCSTYDLMGSHDAPAAGVLPPNVGANRMLGQYADDMMWPWDNVTGGTIGSTKERPNIALLKPFPIVLGAILPFAQPTVRITIDWAGVKFTGPGTSLGYGYDDFNPFLP